MTKTEKLPEPNDETMQPPEKPVKPPMHGGKPLIPVDNRPFPPVVRNKSPITPGKVNIGGGARKTIPGKGAE